nr:hypothetical protein [Dyella sp. ASV24]
MSARLKTVAGTTCITILAGAVVFGVSARTLLAISGSSINALHYTGVAYAADDGQLRYREEHWLFDDRGTPSRLVLYRCPGGAPFARKWVRYTSQPWAPEFALDDARDGYQEGARRTRDGWQVYVRQSAGAPTRTAQLALPPDAVIDAGFDAFVQARWDALSHPGGVSAAFVVPSRLGSLDLRLKPIGGAPSGSRRFRLSLDSWLGSLAPSLELTYADGSRRLERFVGISNIRDDRGHRQRVRIEFPENAVGPAASAAEIAAAAQVPLSAHCSQ